MPYRDETARLQSRTGELEEELASVNAQLKLARTRKAELERELDSIDENAVPAPVRFGEWLAGARTGFEFREVVVRELSPSVLDAIVDALRLSFSVNGETTRSEGGLSWRYASPSRHRLISVDVFAYEDKVVIRVADQLSNFALGVLKGALGIGVGIIPTVLAAGVVTGSIRVVVPFLLGWFVFTWIPIRFGVARYAERRVRQLQGALRAITAILSSARTAASTGVDVPAPSLFNPEQPERQIH